MVPTTAKPTDNLDALATAGASTYKVSEIMDMVRVASDASARTLATRLLVQAGQGGQVIAQAIGAAAVNSIVKAVGIMRQESGEEWACFPDFATVHGEDGRELSAVRITVRKLSTAPQHRQPRAPRGLP